MINKENAVEEILKGFPDFDFEPGLDLDGNYLYTIVFNGLVRRIITGIEKNDETPAMKVANFINSLDLNESIMRASLSEIVIGLYAYDGGEYIFEFIEKLNKPAADFFYEGIRLWEGQAQKPKKLNEY